MKSSNTYFIGIEIGGTKLQIVLGDHEARILERYRAGVDRSKGAAGIQGAGGCGAGRRLTDFRRFMTLSHISIKRPVLTSMMSLALILFGVISLLRLPVRELPAAPHIDGYPDDWTGAGQGLEFSSADGVLQPLGGVLPVVSTHLLVPCHSE